MNDTKLIYNVAIIPARGGSKGIPNKNIIDFCGKPLLAWSILQAKEANNVSEVYVSSDDDRILDIAVQYGALPIRRPFELATDTSSSEEALIHALAAITENNGAKPDLIVFLQATSVLREPEDIDGAIATFASEKADSLFSATILDDFCVWEKKGGVFKGLTYDPFSRGRRQDREPLYLENGSIYVFGPDVLISGNNRIGGKTAVFLMPYWKSYEIDSLEQLEVCEFYFRKKLLGKWLPQMGTPLRLEDIDLIVYDFDGVMTDNRVIVLQDGTEAVIATRSDGLGVDLLRASGVPQLILSTETNPVVRARGSKLRLEIIDCCNDKKKALRSYCTNKGYNLQRVVYVGNDINDIEAMRSIGFPVAPADAHPAVKALARVITKSSGGEGVIKELAELLLGNVTYGTGK